MGSIKDAHDELIAKIEHMSEELRVTAECDRLTEQARTAASTAREATRRQRTTMKQQRKNVAAMRQAWRREK